MRKSRAKAWSPKLTLKRAAKKLIEHLVSWKFHLLVFSTWLFMRGTLSESGWLIMAAATTGLREISSILAAKTEGFSGYDNPDQEPATK
jgi:hypothetical protein